MRAAKHWGIRFKRIEPMEDLPDGVEHDTKLPPESEPFPISISGPILKCFVDAAHASCLSDRRSTTGFVFTCSGGAAMCRSKTQTLTAVSSTEAEFIAAVDAAKVARCLRSVLKDLGLEQVEPTPLCEDNKSTMLIVNNDMPAERTRHVDIRFFAIQDWKKDKSIELLHVPGILNPSDDLTKPLGWVPHARHCRRAMGHHND